MAFTRASLLGLLPIAGMVVCWVLLTLYAQGLETEGFSKPVFITYCIRSSFSLMLVPSWILRWRRTGVIWPWKANPADVSALSPSSAASPRASPGPAVPTKQLFLTCLGLYWIAFISGIFWYYSLPRTDASANNAVYQSVPAAVLLFAVFVLGEVLTAQKVVAVIVTIAGVCMVSFSPATMDANKSDSKDGGPTPTVAGYLFVVASVVLYALVEVLYSRYTEQTSIASFKDAFGCGYMSAHARAEREQLAQEKREEDLKGATERSPVVVAATATAVTTNTATTTTATTKSLNDGGGHNETHKRRGSIEISLLEEGGSNTTSPRSDAASSAASTAAAVYVSPAYKAELAAFMLGTMGFLVLITLWPLIIIFNATGLETFEWPDEQHLQKLVIAASLDSFFNVLMLLAISLTDPLFTAVGTVLVVPGTLIATTIAGTGTAIDVVTGVGMAIVILGFLILQIPGRPFRRALRKAGGCCVDKHPAPLTASSANASTTAAAGTVVPVLRTKAGGYTPVAPSEPADASSAAAAATDAVSSSLFSSLSPPEDLPGAAEAAIAVDGDE